MPPTTIGRRPCASSASISACARSRERAGARTSRSIGTKPSSRCSSRACSRRGRAGEDRRGPRRPAARPRRPPPGPRRAARSRVGQRDRHGGLADARRPEDGDHAATARRIRSAHGAVSSPRHGRPHRNRPVDRARPARRGAGGGGDGARGARRARLRSRRASSSPAGSARRGRDGARRRSTRCSRRTSLIGCGAGGVIGHGREIEGGAAVSVWAANLGEDGTATTFHAAVEELEAGTGALTGMADLAGAGGAILLADPVTFPTDAVLRFLTRVDADAAAARRARLRARRWTTRPCCSSTTTSSATGAVGVRLDGVEVLPMVSQGAAPIGPELTITAGEGHVIGELAGKPALEKLKRDDRRAAARGPAADPGRAAGRDRGRLQQARLRAGRLPRARPRRRRPGDRAGGDRRRRPPRTGRPAARARRRERGPRPARGAVDPHDRARRPAARGRAAVRLQRARPQHVRASPTTTPRRSPTRWPARPRRGSSPRARSGRSAAATSCTASRRRWRSSRERSTVLVSC